jgi:ClpX C4-type zinc finger
VRDAHGVLAGTEHEPSPPASSIKSVGVEDGGEQCSFCGKSRNQVGAMASAADARICDECISLCFEIIDS